MGHNSDGAGLAYDLTKFQPLELRAREIADAGASWILLEKIEDEETAQKANDFLSQVKAITKETDAERRKQKKPHEAMGKAVDAAFKSLLDPLDKIAGRVKPQLAAYTQAKAEAERREKARLAEEARQKDPLTVAQNIYFVGSKPGWNTTYMIAKANMHGVFKNPIDWDVSGKGSDTHRSVQRPSWRLHERRCRQQR